MMDVVDAMNVGHPAYARPVQPPPPRAANPATATTPGHALLQLGDFQFSVQTVAPQKIDSDYAWRWQSQDVLAATPALQFLGPGQYTKKINGYLLPHWQGGYSQVDDLRAQADRGTPLLLAAGYGQVFGYWCITKLSCSEGAFDLYGRARKITVDLQIAFYGDRADRWS